MNQYYVWPDYATQTLNVAKIVYENQSYYVARRNGDDRLLCIRRQYLPHANDAAWRPHETGNGLGWNADWTLHLPGKMAVEIQSGGAERRQEPNHRRQKSNRRAGTGAC